ncbi:MAG TPA: lipopolysaccharide heptosyltransferase II [Candidatus Omnitrophota bacterium]|nr:lipopolysaccharide heptosyltransferase II [Candidatus Omnitrophota bacterium]
MIKILVVNVNWVGDVVFSSPVFRSIKEHYPHCHITCLAPQRVRGVLESIPDIDAIIGYDDRTTHRSLVSKIKVWVQLFRSRFHLAFLLHGSLSRALLVFLAGIPFRVGYPTKKRGFLLTCRVPLPEETLHRSDYYLRIIEFFGIRVRDRLTYLQVAPDARKKMSRMLEEYGMDQAHPRILVHVGANWNLKRWPLESFTRLIDQLINNLKAKVIIPGTKEDLPLIDMICAPLKNKPWILAGKTDLKELIALISLSDLLITSDSGPLHLASSVGVKTIALFGPTRPEITGPRGKGRSYILQHDVGCNKDACYDLTCPNNICMQRITVKEVLDAMR